MAAVEEGVHLGREETVLGEKMAGAHAAADHLGAPGRVEIDQRFAGEAAALGGAEGQHVHTGLPGDLGRRAAERRHRIGEARAVHVDAEIVGLGDGGEGLHLLHGIDLAEFGRLGDGERVDRRIVRHAAAERGDGGR